MTVLLVAGMFCLALAAVDAVLTFVERRHDTVVEFKRQRHALRRARTPRYDVDDWPGR